MKHRGPTEHEVQDQIIDWLKHKHVFYYRNNVGAFKMGNRFIRFGKKGAPDIVAVINGIYVGIEVKNESNPQSREQYEFQVSLEKAGGKYVLARKLEDVENALIASERRTR